MDSIMEDVRFIDESINNGSSDYVTVYNSGISHRQQKPSQNARDLEIKSKAIEQIIIKSFFKSIVPVRKVRKSQRSSQQYRLSCGDRTPQDLFQLDLSSQEEEQLSMKLVQILINNYPEIMRIPDELITNVNHRLASKSSGNLQQLQSSANFLGIE